MHTSELSPSPLTRVRGWVPARYFMPTLRCCRTVPPRHKVESSACKCWLRYPATSTVVPRVGTLFWRLSPG
jgi:hypothetical protein